MALALRITASEVLDAENQQHETRHEFYALEFSITVVMHFLARLSAMGQCDMRPNVTPCRTIPDGLSSISVNLIFMEEHF